MILLLLGFFIHAQAQVEEVLFSAQGGIYDHSFQLELNCFYPNHHIRYTTNGNLPSATSPLYEAPLSLDESLYSHSDIYTIPTCPSFLFYEPTSVQHAIVIRAAVFDEEEHLIGNVGTNTYLIHDLGCDTHNLPVISITADSLDLFGYETGILVPGIHFNPVDSLWTGNYYQSGEEWERRVHVEFYEPDGTQGISQDAGLRTHGGTGRRGPQKGMKLYAREEYGTKRFHHKFFEELQIESFKHLVLRPFSCHWFSHGIQDDICNHIASGLQVESLTSRPAVMYLNGEYWGIYYIKEKPDAHYLEDHFGNNDGDYNVIGNWYGKQEDGDNTNFLEMMSWLRNCDLSENAAYQALCSMIDMDCFIDYYCLELFIANNDWPANNMRCYQLQDGVWRWIFFDGDDCLMKMNLDVFDNATSENGHGWPNDPTSTLLFRKLLQNTDFQLRFLSRFDELLSDSFQYSQTKPLLDNAAALVREEVPFQAERFRKPYNLSNWEELVSNIDLFLQQRVDNMRDRINQYFFLEDQQISEVLLSPNPVKDHLTVKLECECFGFTELHLYDLRGHQLVSKQLILQPGINELPLDLTLHAGVYLLEIGSYIQKLIVQ